MSMVKEKSKNSVSVLQSEETKAVFGPAYRKIMKLARDRGVSTEPTSLDVKASAMFDLSDNASPKDMLYHTAKTALVHLRTSGVINAKESHDLLFDLLDEMGLS